MNTVITEKQTKILKNIVAVGKTDTTGYDGRVLRALENRGLVKVSETTKGIFVTATAKGKKVN